MKIAKMQPKRLFISRLWESSCRSVEIGMTGKRSSEAVSEADPDSAPERRTTPVGDRSGGDAEPARRTVAPDPSTSGSPDSGKSHGLEAAAKAALDRIDRTSGDEPAKATRMKTPWYLCLGDGGASLPTFLAHGMTRSTPERDSEFADDGWFWWVMPKMVAIELGRSLITRKSSKDGHWSKLERALGLLSRYRAGPPLNGIVCCIRQESLADRARACDLAERMREVVMEVYAGLRHSVPVHIVVLSTGQVAGHQGFFAEVSKASASRALGHRFDPPAELGRLHDVFPTVFTAMMQRLEAVRLGLLYDSDDKADRYGIFEFVEAIRDLEEPLTEFLRVLLEENQHDHRLVWRGLYFAAEQAPRPEFTHTVDLFERFLPEDAGLVSQL